MAHLDRGLGPEAIAGLMQFKSNGTPSPLPVRGVPPVTGDEDVAEGTLLRGISAPSKIRAFDIPMLEQLADELRQFLLASVSRTGGHLASNLGTVELTVALHHVFETPEDRVIWDVGHQAYAHKILTGRAVAMSTLRMAGGLSGFPRRDESPYDAFGTAHSSTSISAALGMAIAAKALGESRKVAAVIGDGALSAGMAFEALNNAGAAGADLLVVLNDNRMSISPSVGALDGYLAGLASQHAGRGSGNLFQHFGFDYSGPVDGHDIPVLVEELRRLRAQRGPKLLHVITRKGKGYARAEAEPVLYHGVSRFDPARGLGEAKPGGKMTFTQVFGDWICDMAARDPRVVAITPAMSEGSGLNRFARAYPDRYFDVGIAEQHALTFAAGLACGGMKPVVAIYSTFLQRAYDQLIHDIQLQNLPVLLAVDRAGVAGADGATHHGAFDLSYLRCIPNITLMVPADENECRQMLYTGYLLDSPAVVRYPRGAGPGAEVAGDLTALPIGRAQLQRSGNRVAFLVFGTLLSAVLEAADEIDASVANMRFVKPLDEAMVLHLATSHDLLVSVEENVVAGGAGGAVSDCLDRLAIPVPLLKLGLPDRFVDHGTQPQLLAREGLDREGILTAVRERLFRADVRPADGAAGGALLHPMGPIA